MRLLEKKSKSVTGDRCSVCGGYWKVKFEICKLQFGGKG